MLIVEYSKPKSFNPAEVLAPSLAEEKGWFSRRVVGDMQPNTGQIVNQRQKLRRNRKVSIGGIIQKFKRFADIQRMPIPSQVIKNRKVTRD